MSPERSVAWAPEANDDLAAILAWVSHKDAKAARKLIRSLIALGKSIPDNPEAGAIVEDAPAYRQRVLAPYRLIYRLDETTVWIARVWDGRRDPTTLGL